MSTQFEIERSSKFQADERTDERFEFDATEARTFLRYTVSAGYKGALRDYQYTDHTGTFGVKFGNKLYALCNVAWLRTVTNKCDKSGAIGFNVEPYVDVIGSSRQSRRRATPGLKIGFVVPFRDMEFFADAKGERRMFLDARIPAGPRRSDTTVSLDAGVNLSVLVKRLGLGPASKLTVGGRYVRNRSNNPLENYNRVFFVPSLEVAGAFR